MDLAAARSVLRQAITSVIEEEIDLFALGAGERAIVHQLGLRVRRLVHPDFDVDVEYDREGSETHHKLIPPPHRGVPDLVVHQRGYWGPARNLLVLEVKRRWHGTHGSAGDVAKVRAAMSKFGFGFGATLELASGSQFLCPRWSWWRRTETGQVELVIAAENVYRTEDLVQIQDTGYLTLEAKCRPGWAEPGLEHPEFE